MTGTRRCHRKQAIRHNVNAFCSEFRGEAQEEPPQQTQSSPLAGQGNHDQNYESSTSERVVSFISTVVSAYKTFSSKTYLQQVIDRFRLSEQTHLESLSTPGEASMDVIRNMMEGKGVLDSAQADSVVCAFKVRRRLSHKGGRDC